MEARYRNKNGLTWLGYNVHLSETCDEQTPHLITQVITTPANVGDAKCTAAIQAAEMFFILQGEGRATCDRKTVAIEAEDSIIVLIETVVLDQQ